jgi:FtsP/CotA-like multicopper oxidase with cupredoxin domain
MRGVTLLAGLLARVAFAAPSPLVHEEKRQTPGCQFNSAETPECWDGVFNLNSNYYEERPQGKEKEFFFELTTMNMAPDGVNKTVMAVNGQIPGPTIEANWGDTISELRLGLTVVPVDAKDRLLTTRQSSTLPTIFPRMLSRERRSTSMAFAST